MVSASTYPSFYSSYILHTSLTLSVRNIQGMAVLRVANTRRTVWIDLMYTEKKKHSSYIQETYMPYHQPRLQWACMKSVTAQILSRNTAVANVKRKKSIELSKGEALSLYT